jgi:hypothetical protein
MHSGSSRVVLPFAIVDGLNARKQTPEKSSGGAAYWSTRETVERLLAAGYANRWLVEAAAPGLDVLPPPVEASSSAMATLTCTGCGQSLPPTALHYRFALALEGEQQALDGPPPERAKEALTALFHALEQADERELEAQVHFEASGVLCPRCRRRLLEAIGHAPVGPH